MGSRIAARLVSSLGALAVLVVGGVIGCSSTSNDPQFAEVSIGTVVLPGPSGAERLSVSPSDPQELPGVDTSDLVPREKKQWWKLVSQLYSPCPDQAVSIAQCVQEQRPCAACPAAAQLLASRVRSGATVAECEAVYGARFGPNIKKPDLTGSPSRGPEDAPVTIVVWSDFQCPACKYALPIIDEAVEKHAKHVRLVHKFYPLKFHTHAEVAAKAAVAAHNQGRYWPFEKLLFDNQSALTETDLDKYAKAVGLDMARFHADMGSKNTAAVIQRDKDEAEKAGLGGTPFILVNGREVILGLFRVESELEPWIALEVELAQKSKAMAVPAPEGAPAGDVQKQPASSAPN